MNMPSLPAAAGANNQTTAASMPGLADKRAAWLREMERALAQAWFGHLPQAGDAREEVPALTAEKKRPDAPLQATRTMPTGDEGQVQMLLPDANGRTRMPVREQSQAMYAGAVQDKLRNSALLHVGSAPSGSFPLVGGRLGWGCDGRASTSDNSSTQPPSQPSPCQGEGAGQCASHLPQKVSADLWVNLSFGPMLEFSEIPSFDVRVEEALPSLPPLPASPSVPRGPALQEESEADHASPCDPPQPLPQRPPPAEPLRLHTEWSSEGVRLWLGADAQLSAAVPQLTQQVIRWLEGQGVRLLSLVYNGKALYGGRQCLVDENVGAPAPDETRGETVHPPRNASNQQGEAR